MKKYCVYVTFYGGNKMPPFYIGSSSVDRINAGYMGSVSSRDYRDVWKYEKTNNPHLFKTYIISICETREDAFTKEHMFHVKMDVVNNPLYINKWYARVEKNFKPNFGSDNPMYGKKHSAETKKKISKSNKGRKLSSEAKRKQSISQTAWGGENSWNQLSDGIKKRYETLGNLRIEITKLMSEYHNCPALVSSHIGDISIEAIRTISGHLGIPCNNDSSFVKIVGKYGKRWATYSDYVNSILELHAKLLCNEHIARELGINPAGIITVLAKHNMIANSRHDRIMLEIYDGVIAMYENKTSTYKIAKHFKTTELVIKKILNKHLDDNLPKL